MTIDYLYPFSVGWELGDDSAGGPASGCLISWSSSSNVSWSCGHLKAFPGPADPVARCLTHLAGQLLLAVHRRPQFLTAWIPGYLRFLTTWPLASLRMGENLLFVTKTWKPHTVISVVTARCSYCGRGHAGGHWCQIARPGWGRWGGILDTGCHLNYVNKTM